MKTLLAVAAAPIFSTTNGITLRQVMLLKHLRHNWRLVLACPGTPGPTGASAVDDLIEVPALPRWNPCPASRDRAALRAALDRVRRRVAPDAMLLWPGAEHSAMPHPGTLTTVSDRIDAMTLSAWRDLRRLGRRARRHHITTVAAFAAYERRLVRTSSATVVVGEDDARMLRWLGGSRKVHVVGNGADVDGPMHPHGDHGHPVVAFTGILNFPPNVEAVLGFVRDTWPGIRARHPLARFVVAGRDPVPSILALHGIAGVEVLSNVPCMPSVIRSAWVSVAPMRSGTGVKNKVLEAWAEGRPVVMTTMASNGLEATPANAGLIVDDPGAMAAKVSALLDCSGMRTTLGASLRAHVQQRHQWEPLARRMSVLLEQSHGERAPG